MRKPKEKERVEEAELEILATIPLVTLAEEP